MHRSINKIFSKFETLWPPENMSKDGSLRNLMIKIALLVIMIIGGYPGGYDQTQYFFDYHKNENVKVKNDYSMLLSPKNP